MIPIKTEKEIKLMGEGGERLFRVMDSLLKRVELGVKLSELDRLAEALIKKEGGKPSFKIVPDYHWATCININQGVVHGIPTDYQVKKGDLVSLDIGMFYQGLHTDMARTIKAGGGESKFLKAGTTALKKAIQKGKAGNYVGHISQAIEREIKKFGFNPVWALIGHGVGRKLHEAPQIPCFLGGKVEETPELKPGMTLAIEVIYAEGNPAVVLVKDGWTVKTRDGSLAGLFEDTILVTETQPLILTVAS